VEKSGIWYRLRWVWAALALIPAAFLTWQGRDLAHFGRMHDDGLYWLGAKSLLEQGKYLIESLAAQPSQTKYPPLYSVILAATNGSFQTALLITWLALPLILFLLWQFFQGRSLSSRSTIGLMVGFGICPSVVYFSAALMPDLLFVALVIAACLLAEKQRPGLAGLATAAAYLLKTMALPLMLGLGCWFLIKKQFRSALVFSALAAPAFLLWTWWSKAHIPAGSDPVTLYYANYFGYRSLIVNAQELPNLVWMNTDYFLRMIGNLAIYNLAETFWGIHLGRFLGVVAIIGTIRDARRSGLHPYHCFAVFFIPMILIWHFPPVERFVLPIFPLLLLGLWHELKFLWNLIKASWQKSSSDRVVGVAIGATLAILVGISLSRSLWADFQDLPNINASFRIPGNRMQPLYRWAKTNLPETSVVYAYDDVLFYLATGRRACRIPVSPMAFYRDSKAELLKFHREFSKFAAEQKLTHVVLSDSDGYSDLGPMAGEARSLIEKTPGLKLVYSGTGAKLYEIELKSIAAN
jgi:hypothetical protein